MGMVMSKNISVSSLWTHFKDFLPEPYYNVYPMTWNLVRGECGIDVPMIATGRELPWFLQSLH
jgi:hypothetical protein